MPQQIVNGCGSKHFKLACWIIGMTVAITLSIVTAALRGVDEQEERLRAVETRQASVLTKLDAIQRGQDKTDAKLDKLLERSRP